MEHIVDFVCFAPMVQIFDAPVQQTVEQLPDIFRFFDTLTTDPEHVIEVPKILPRGRVHANGCSRTAAGGTVGGSADSPCPSTQRRKTLSWRWPAMPLAARGSRYLDRAVVAGGSCRVRATPSGTTQRGTPPGQGGIEILDRDDVDVPSIMQLVFQQSKSYVFFAAISSLDRVPQCSPSTRLLPLLCTTVAYGPDNADSCVHRRGRRHPCCRLHKWRCLRFSHRQSSMTI